MSPETSSSLAFNIGPWCMEWRRLDCSPVRTSIGTPKTQLISAMTGGSIDSAFAKHQLRRSAFGGTQGFQRHDEARARYEAFVRPLRCEIL
jgi:hypothetical protein